MFSSAATDLFPGFDVPSHDSTMMSYLTSEARLSQNVVNLMTEVFGKKYNLFQFLLDSVGSNIMEGSLDPETVDGSLDLIIDACGDLATPDLMQLKLELPPTVNLPMAHSAAIFFKYGASSRSTNRSDGSVVAAIWHSVSCTCNRVRQL